MHTYDSLHDLIRRFFDVYNRQDWKEVIMCGSILDVSEEKEACGNFFTNVRPYQNTSDNWTKMKLKIIQREIRAHNLYRAKPVPITKLKSRTFYGRHSRVELWNVLGFKNLPSNQFRSNQSNEAGSTFPHGLHSP